MTITEALTQLRSIKPNPYDDRTLIRWLSDLDGLLYRAFVRWHEGGEDVPHGPYDPEADTDAVLMVPAPYSDLYIKYLAAQADFYNGEFGRYNNSMVMYNTALSAFADGYTRDRMPRQERVIRI